jgi:hypothetical protein
MNKTLQWIIVFRDENIDVNNYRDISFGIISRNVDASYNSLSKFMGNFKNNIFPFLSSKDNIAIAAWLTQKANIEEIANFERNLLKRHEDQSQIHENLRG